MKFRCVVDYIKSAVAAAERFTGKHATLPILSHILFEVKDGALRVAATNLESAYQTKIAGDRQKDGRVAVPAKVLGSFLQSLKDDTLSLEERQGNLYLKTDTRQTRINGMAAEDFPIIPTIVPSSLFQVDAALLARGFASVLPAVSLSEFKPELRGVLVALAGSELSLAATDTFRLAEFTTSLESGSQKEKTSFILPHRIAQEVARIAREGEMTAMGTDANYALVTFGNVSIISRLIEGVFPDYRAIIPSTFETSCFVSRPQLADAVRSSSIFASKLQDVRLWAEGKMMEVSSSNQDIGEHTITIPCSISGKEARVSFNYRYLLDGIQLFDEDEIFMGLNGGQGKAMLRNKSDESARYVVMPIRLS